MVQSVKSNLQLFFAVISLTAMMLVTLGNSPPLDYQFRLIPFIETSEPQKCVTDFKHDIARVQSLVHVVESPKNNCVEKTAALTDNSATTN